MPAELANMVRTWPVSLDQPPEVVRVGVGRHGVHRLVEHWRLPDLWSLHLYRYNGSLTIDHDTLAISPGDVSVVPPGVGMRFRYQGPSTHLFAHLRLSTKSAHRQLPAMQALGDADPEIAAWWEDAVTAFSTTIPRCQADIWCVLWRLVTSAESPRARPHDRNPVVTAAIGFLEMHLADPLTVPDVARHVGVSHNHLTRLFRAHTGWTVVGYIRWRRAEQAEHLLRHSTLPITAIAAAVGIPDLQAFNKTVRQELGRSPRAVRDG